MALYKYVSVVLKSEDAAFDAIYSPGDTTAHSGIYRCEGCAREISHHANSTLPAQNHHQHTAAQGTIRWRMIVYTQTNG